MAIVRCPTCGTSTRFVDPRTLRIACPECGDLLAVPKPVTTIRCEHCGTSNEVANPEAGLSRCTDCGGLLADPLVETARRPPVARPVSRSQRGGGVTGQAPWWLKIGRIPNSTLLCGLAIGAIVMCLFSLLIASHQNKLRTGVEGSEPVAKKEREPSQRPTGDPSPNVMPEREKEREQSLHTGDVGTVSFKDEREVLVAATYPDQELMYKYTRAKDEYGLVQLVAARRLFVVPIGTRVRIIQTHVLTYEVRILEGANAGVEAIFPREMVRR